VTDNLIEEEASASSLIHSLTTNHRAELLVIFYDGSVQVLTGIDPESELIVAQELEFAEC